MSTKHKFDKSFLDEFCKKNNITYEVEDDKISRDTKIKGKCITDGCPNEFEKTFRMMVERSNGYCKKCTTEISSIKSNTEEYKSNYTELMVYIKENNINLCSKYENINITKEGTRIIGQCINKLCNNTFDKNI